jgi:RNA polymerase sigma-70 factor (ECF subfamily)
VAAPAEFEELFDSTFATAVRLAEGVVGPDEAEPVAIEAFARALARWSKVERVPCREAKVLQVTADIALDRLRRRSQSPVVAPASLEELDAAGSTAPAFATALRRLSRRQAEVLVMHRVASVPVEQIATALGADVTEVQADLDRAVASLREVLDVPFP